MHLFPLKLKIENRHENNTFSLVELKKEITANLEGFTH